MTACDQMFTTPRAIDAMIGRTGCHCEGRSVKGTSRVCGGTGSEGGVEGEVRERRRGEKVLVGGREIRGGSGCGRGRNR